ncbi:prtrc system protein e [Pedobacter sp. GR22-10]|uniref:prtrc system protein e n=1 Tax=Pedobacter sp. GR22-10 TaxID=2994472 RepID=UPI002245D85E|nr:prtrc system protein e [Pedobacter sp. GR22-10]MCX2429870.1 prtrc system protein e [Pedobacter sp. GR22-10]
METNFFKQIAAMQANGEWVIVVKPIGTEKIIVSVLYNDDSCGDNARKSIPPLTFSNTAAALDDAFFADIRTAFTGTIQLHNSMEHYLKQQEAAGQQAQMNKKPSATIKQKAEPISKYDAAIQKVAELEAQEKYREAWMKVPDPAEYPDKADFLRKRREELSVHFAPDLFNI